MGDVKNISGATTYKPNQVKRKKKTTFPMSMVGASYAYISNTDEALS